MAKKKKAKTAALKKSLILVFIFLGAWLAAFSWMKWRYTVPDAALKQEKLINCDAEKIGEIRIQIREQQNTVQKISLRRTQKSPYLVWEIIEPKLGEADAGLADRLATMFCELYGAEPSSKTFSSGGFSDESIELELVDENNVISRVWLSGAKAGRETLIAIGDSTKKVFQALPVWREIAKLPPERFRNRRIMRMAGDNILELCIEQPTKPRFCFSREGAEWMLTRDDKVLGHTTVEADKYVNRISTVTAIEILHADNGIEKCRTMLPPGSFTRIQLSGVADRKENIYMSMKPTTTKTGVKVLLACDSERSASFGVHPSFKNYLRVEPFRLLEKKR